MTISDYMRSLTKKEPELPIKPEDIEAPPPPVGPQSDFHGADVARITESEKRALSMLRGNEAELVGEIKRLNDALSGTRLAIRAREASFKILSERPLSLSKPRETTNGEA